MFPGKAVYVIRVNFQLLERIFMPLPSKKKGEKRTKFVSRCVSQLAKLGEGKDTEQRVAICNTQFEKGTRAEILEDFAESLIGKEGQDD
jgi:hypothetical protein